MKTKWTKTATRIVWICSLWSLLGISAAGSTSGYGYATVILLAGAGGAFMYSCLYPKESK